MIKYLDKNQTKMEEFLYPLPERLDTNNRWVKLSKVLPWDRLKSIYEQKLSRSEGRPSIDARQVIGALIIKHKLNLSDDETIETIRENHYLQYFLGLESFRYEQIFTPSLFVAIRKRLGREEYDEMTSELFNIAFPRKYKAGRSLSKGKTFKSDDDNEAGNYSETSKNNQTEGMSETKKDIPDQPSNNENRPSATDIADENKEDNKSDTFASKETQDILTIEDLISKSSQIRRKGDILMDATVAEQSIKYPTDLNLLNECRIISETIIDELYAKELVEKKPRTYRRNAKKDYLSASKRRKLSVKDRRKANKKQLNYLKRNINNIEKILDSTDEIIFPLSYKLQRKYWIIKEIYRQQLEMNVEKKNTCKNRIVSISQPHVRPIKRGKTNKNVEFGAKLGVYMIDGYSRLMNISWDAYNESSDLKEIILHYYLETGYLPKRILADSIYGNHENRKLMKQLGIEYIGKPLGRPPKVTEENKADLQKEKRRRKRLYQKRIPIEGKFGQGKNGYNLNYIRAKLKETSESWISGIFFLMNVVKLATKKINSIANKAILTKYCEKIDEHLKKIITIGYFSKKTQIFST